MKALAVRQPWATLIVQGVKQIENRSWSTKYRGPLAILASKTVNDNDMCAARKFCEANGYPWPAEFPTGGIVGVVNLVGFVQGYGNDLVSDNPAALPKTIDLGFYNDGAIGWVFTDPKQCQFVRFGGKLGLFDIPDNLIRF